MRLIADIGGTTSRWVFPEKGISSMVKLEGYNPVAQSGQNTFIKGLDKLASHSVSELLIYGAGCGSVERQEEVKQKAAQHFKNASIKVHSDLLAVGHAGLGRDKGMVAILGTGMNVAYYDGQGLVQRVPSLGYLMGDEGSGAYIGKRFLNDFFNRRVPIDLITKVFPKGNPSLPDTLKQVYGNEAKNRALASYIPYLAAHQEHPYVRDLVGSSFREFLNLVREHHTEDPMEPFVVSGGVGQAFENLLKEVMKQEGMNDLQVQADPISGLIAYHLEDHS